MNRGPLFILTSATAFGTMAVIASQAYASGLDVPTLMFLRFTLSSIFLWGFVGLRREKLPPPKTAATLGFMGAVLYFGQSITFFTALRHIPAAMVSLLLYLYPVVVTVFAVAFLGERMTKAKGIALMVALFGTALTIGPVKAGSFLGIGLGVATALFYSAYILVGTRAVRGVSPVMTTAMVMGSTALVYVAIGAIQGFSPITPAGFGWAAALAGVSVVAIGTFLAGLEETGPVNASILSALEPIVTAVLAVVLMGQVLGPTQWIGGVMIVGAVVALVKAQR